MAEYHKCAREVGKCKGLKQGVKGYHKCATASNCKKPERQKLQAIGKRLEETRAKQFLKKRHFLKEKKLDSIFKEEMQDQTRPKNDVRESMIANAAKRGLVRKTNKAYYTQEFIDSKNDMVLIGEMVDKLLKDYRKKSKPKPKPAAKAKPKPKPKPKAKPKPRTKKNM